MFDYLNSYGDMSVFCVLLDEGNINSAIDNLCREMGFAFKEKRDMVRVYSSENDDRSFLMSVKETTPEHFYLLYIKCKSAYKDLFLNCIDKQLQEMEDWGIVKKSADEYDDLLRLKMRHGNPYVQDLKEFGFI